MHDAGLEGPQLVAGLQAGSSGRIVAELAGAREVGDYQLVMNDYRTADGWERYLAT